MTTFQRARSEEQRETRRLSILATAASMLSEMPVSALSLNELSRRVGLAKSNVLRYFESREAVLLELLASMARDFLTEVVDQLPAHIDGAAPAPARIKSTASILAASFASHEMLCELLSVQAGILDHNISTEVATHYKRGTQSALSGLAALFRNVLPELDDQQAAEAANMTIVLAGSLWTHTHPGPAVRAVYEADPDLAFLPTFTVALDRALTLLLTGLLSDPAR
ncbi:TetR family transcriptional regulator [Nocardia sp. NPDC127606]|uniref:TetR/AcrR family transcriptional regulator n=1 Tax=Nocardia sp. NPDC127606 TaxID=3345406 RepID=UPI003644ACC0